MKKCTISNYYYSIEKYLNDAGRDNNEPYRELLKDIVHAKPKSEIPPIRYTDDNGNIFQAFSDEEKAELLDNFLLQFQISMT